MPAKKTPKKVTAKKASTPVKKSSVVKRAPAKRKASPLRVKPSDEKEDIEASPDVSLDDDEDEEEIGSLFDQSAEPGDSEESTPIVDESCD